MKIQSINAIAFTGRKHKKNNQIQNASQPKQQMTFPNIKVEDFNPYTRYGYNGKIAIKAINQEEKETKPIITQVNPREHEIEFSDGRRVNIYFDDRQSYMIKETLPQDTKLISKVQFFTQYTYSKPQETRVSYQNQEGDILEYRLTYTPKPTVKTHTNEDGSVVPDIEIYPAQGAARYPKTFYDLEHEKIAYPSFATIIKRVWEAK
ncbi:hypothetical protein IJ531_07345 [bacterium]|nr:hypothetical protein [bacterium]